MNQDDDVHRESIGNGPFPIESISRKAEDEKMEEVEVAMEFEVQSAGHSRHEEVQQTLCREYQSHSGFDGGTLPSNDVRSPSHGAVDGDGHDKNEYILQHADSRQGLSVPWNDTEYDVLERQMDSDRAVNRRPYPRASETKEADTNSSPIKYVETVRGKKRQLLPGNCPAMHDECVFTVRGPV